MALEAAPDSIPLVDFALRYARRGFRVLPCHAHTKAPLCEHGAKDATTDEATIREWFQRWPHAGIGMALDGLVAVDVDIRDGKRGAETFDALVAKHGPLPDGPVQRTRSGGSHYLLKARAGASYPGTAGTDIDLKHGPNSYIIVEPTQGYGWLDELDPWREDVEIPEAPRWLERAARAEAPPSGERDAGKGRTLPAHEVERVRAMLRYCGDFDNHDAWVRAGMALHHETGGRAQGFELWTTWAQQSTKFDLEEHHKRWQSFARSDGQRVTLASLAYIARGNGWREELGEQGSGAVRGLIAEAVSDAGGEDLRADPPPLSPPRMPAEGFPSLVRDVVDAACANSEAHPVAVAANFIAFFSCLIGRGLFQRIGDAVIHCRPFLLIVGKSGKARKGTAEHTVRELFRRVGALLRQMLSNADRMRVHAGGLSTGEGIAWAIRDAQEADEAGKGGDVGVHDKRLLVIESEFDNLLSQLRRENNTLSATLRNLFDGRDIEPMTKTSRTRASRPHVVGIGHITGHELREKSTANDAANGTLNRWAMLYVYRPKLVPLPAPTPEAQLDALAQRIADAIVGAAGADLHANNTHEVRLNLAARQLWIDRYPQLTRDRDGKGGSLLARSEMYARMLAMIFAAIAGRREIEPGDLHAAIAWVEYWHASVTYVFNTPDDEGGLDPFTTKVFDVIVAQPGITLTSLQECWKRKRIKEVKASLERLMNLAPPLVEQRKDASTGGRAALKFYAYGKGSVK